MNLEDAAWDATTRVVMESTFRIVGSGVAARAATRAAVWSAKNAVAAFIPVTLGLVDRVLSEQ